MKGGDDTNLTHEGPLEKEIAEGNQEARASTTSTSRRDIEKFCLARKAFEVH